MVLGPTLFMRQPVQLLALALIGWIATGCLLVGYVANMSQSMVAALDTAFVDLAEQAKAIGSQAKRLDITENVANYAKDQARLANRVAGDAQKAIDEHEAAVEAIRRANAEAAVRASKPRRRHGG